MPDPLIFRDSDYNNLEYVRSIVLTRLKNDTAWNQFDYSWDDGYQNVVRFDPERLRARFITLSNEVMWQFLMQGVITVGLNSSNPSLPWFRVTDYGRTVLEANRFAPHDPTGYLSQISSRGAAAVSAVSTAYIEEALNCFNRGCHIASILLLGIAAESVFNDLCDVVRSNLANPTEAQFLDLSKQVKPRHRFLIDKYRSLSSPVRRSLSESLDTTLTSLYDLIRIQRNEFGHPQDTPPSMTREQAFVFFQLVPVFVNDVRIFGEYCQQNRI